jgi:hypothetical protein
VTWVVLSVVTTALLAFCISTVTAGDIVFFDVVLDGWVPKASFVAPAAVTVMALVPELLACGEVVAA